MCSAPCVRAFTYLFMAVLGLHCCVRTFSSCGAGFLFVVASPLQSTGPRYTGFGVAAPQFAESSWTRDRTYVPCTGRQILVHCATREVPCGSFVFGFQGCQQQSQTRWLWVLACLVAQSCLTLCDPMDCSPQGFSFHGIFQARILEWVAMSFSRGIFLTQGFKLSPVSRFFTHWAILKQPKMYLLKSPGARGLNLRYWQGWFLRRL